MDSAIIFITAVAQPNTTPSTKRNEHPRENQNTLRVHTSCCKVTYDELSRADEGEVQRVRLQGMRWRAQWVCVGLHDSGARTPAPCVVGHSCRFIPTRWSLRIAITANVVTIRVQSGWYSRSHVSSPRATQRRHYLTKAAAKSRSSAHICWLLTAALEISR